MVTEDANINRNLSTPLILLIGFCRHYHFWRMIIGGSLLDHHPLKSSSIPFPYLNSLFTEDCHP